MPNAFRVEQKISSMRSTWLSGIRDAAKLSRSRAWRYPGCAALFKIRIKSAPAHA